MFKIEDVATHLFGKEETDSFTLYVKSKYSENSTAGVVGNEANSFLKSLVEGTTQPPELHQAVAENIRKFFKQNLEGRNTKCDVSMEGVFLKGECGAVTTTGERVTITELVTGDEGIGIVRAVLYGIIYCKGSLNFDVVVFNPVSGVEYRLGGDARGKGKGRDLIRKISIRYNRIHFFWVKDGITYHAFRGKDGKVGPDGVGWGKGRGVFYTGDILDNRFPGEECVKFG